MANDFSAIGGKIVAQGLLSLRENAIMARTVNVDYSVDAQNKEGDTINVPIPRPIASRAVSPGPIPVAPADNSATTTPIVLNKWREAPFSLTDKEIGEIANSAGWLPMSVSAAIRSLASDINNDIYALYKNVYGFAGTPGVTPFPIGTGNFAAPPKDATDTRKVLNKQLCPDDGMRRFVLDPDAEANALQLPAFANMQVTGDAGPAIRGDLGTKLNFRWFMDQQAPTHTAGTITGSLTAKSATPQAAGLTTIVGNTGPSGAISLVFGDIIVIAGQKQKTFVVTSAATQASASSDVNISISPALDTALAGGEAITVKGNHVVNLAFHRDAFAFATRLPNIGFTGANIVLPTVDPKTGITLTLEIVRGNAQTMWFFRTLYGVGILRPELACRLAG
jgi:hypothetical protein